MEEEDVVKECLTNALTDDGLMGMFEVGAGCGWWVTWVVWVEMGVDFLAWVPFEVEPPSSFVEANVGRCVEISKRQRDRDAAG